MHNSPRSHHTPPPCLPGDANVLGRSVTAAVAVWQWQFAGVVGVCDARPRVTPTSPDRDAENADISRWENQLELCADELVVGDGVGWSSECAVSVLSHPV